MGADGKPAATTWATLSDYQQELFYMHHPTDRIKHTTAFVTPVVEHCLEREIAAAGFLSRYLSGPLPYVWQHITINKMC